MILQFKIAVFFLSMFENSRNENEKKETVLCGPSEIILTC